MNACEKDVRLLLCQDSAGKMIQKSSFRQMSRCSIARSDGCVMARSDATDRGSASKDGEIQDRPVTSLAHRLFRVEVNFKRRAANTSFRSFDFFSALCPEDCKVQCPHTNIPHTLPIMQSVLPLTMFSKALHFQTWRDTKAKMNPKCD